MLPEHKLSYQSMVPRSWPENKESPSNATEEVLDKWKSRSFPRGEHPCKKIVFTIKSHDQGWGGRGSDRGTYNGSCTWFDVGLERVSAFRESELFQAPAFLTRWKALSMESRRYFSQNSKGRLAALLESWETAPYPQFRLSTDGQNPPDDPSATEPKDTATSLVCSLRTIIPTTITHSRDDPENSHAFVFELNPDEKALQRNRTATRETKEHIITWSCDDGINPESAEANELNQQGRGSATGTGEIVRNMKVGDAITVWAKARYGGWANHVEEVKIDVYWAA